MDWLNLHTSVLDSEAVIGSEPVDRATWLFLLRYCCGQENGGRIGNCLDWGDRRWQQLCRVTLAEVQRRSELWRWDGADLVIAFYFVEKEVEVQRLRGQASAAAHKRWKKERDARAMPGGIGSGNAEEKRREEKRMEGGATQPPPIPFSGKIDTSTLLASFGLPNGPKDTAEWRGGLGKVARCRSEPEARAFIGWAMGICLRQGVEVEHFRHVRALAAEWPTSIHNRFIEPSPREDAQ